MGHGTAVPGHFDIDLVIYSRGKSCVFYQTVHIQTFMSDIDGSAALQPNAFQSWVRELHAFLSSKLGHNYGHQGMTKRSVQFVYKGRVEVDLLVSPYWENQHKLYRFLQSLPQEKRSR